MTTDQRRDPENGIWLCAVCATEIDKDPARFPVYLLRQWKVAAEAEAIALLASPITRQLGVPRAPFAPPLSYQREALHQLIEHLLRSGVLRVPLPKLAAILPDWRLRDGINPIFEPLRVEKIVDALNEMLELGSIRVDGQDIILEQVARQMVK